MRNIKNRKDKKIKITFQSPNQIQEVVIIVIVEVVVNE